MYKEKKYKKMANMTKSYKMLKNYKLLLYKTKKKFYYSQVGN